MTEAMMWSATLNKPTNRWFQRFGFVQSWKRRIYAHIMKSHHLAAWSFAVFNQCFFGSLFHVFLFWIHHWKKNCFLKTPANNMRFQTDFTKQNWDKTLPGMDQQELSLQVELIGIIYGHWFHSENKGGDVRCGYGQVGHVKPSTGISGRACKSTWSDQRDHRASSEQGFTRLSKQRGPNSYDFFSFQKQDETHEPECRHVFVTFSNEPTCRTPWLDTLRWHSSRTSLLDTIAQRSGTTLLHDTLIWHSCGTLLLDTLVSHTFLTLLTWHSCKTTWRSCKTLLIDTVLGHSYLTLLQDYLTLL